MIVLKNATIFDGVSDSVKRNCTVILDGEKILEVKEQDDSVYERNCDVIDLDGRVLMPGLIDCHMHFLQAEIPEPDKRLNDHTPGGEELDNTSAYYCYRGVYSCKRLLDIGITTAFDGGGNNYAEFALRESARTGLFEAPDIYVCGLQITAGRGHLAGIGYEAHGVEEMRKAVRKMLWYGADHIKLKMSAPMRIPGRNTERSEYSIEEIRAACDEAHAAGLLVSAHARSAVSIKEFLLGGGDRVVHGTGIDDEGIEMILKRDLYVYPTLSSPYFDCSDAVKSTMTKRAIEAKVKKGYEHNESCKRMYKAGIKFAFSTDTGTGDNWPGNNTKELLRMKEIGMSNIEILRSATSEAAKATGIDHQVGVVKPGFRANLIVLEKDPIQDLNQVLDVKMVIKAGKIVRNKLPIVLPF